MLQCRCRQRADPGPEESAKDQAAVLTCRYMQTSSSRAGPCPAHGNGPQVGFIPRQHRQGCWRFSGRYADANTHGAIDCMFARLVQRTQARGISRRSSRCRRWWRYDDRAFGPKPIGAHMDENTAKALAQQLSGTVRTPGGWRRSSLRPIRESSAAAIRQLVSEGFISSPAGRGHSVMTDNHAAAGAGSGDRQRPRLELTGPAAGC